MSIQAGPSRHWTVQEIPFGSIDRQRARGDPYLLYLVAGASFVEITSDGGPPCCSGQSDPPW